jgi:lipopolysaccharide export system permease protein
MKILTVYILATFAKILGFVLPVFIGLYLVVEFVERLDDFLHYQASIETILLYFLLRVPVVGVQVAPMAILLSVALCVALLQRSREIIALLAAGTSPWHIIHPFLIGALVMAGICLGAEELILPRAHRTLMDLQDEQRRPPPQGTLIQQGEIWFRASEATFVHIELLDPAAERLHGITIYRKDAAGELIEQVHAKLSGCPATGPCWMERSVASRGISRRRSKASDGLKCRSGWNQRRCAQCLRRRYI